jgi:transposase-like protein
MPAGVLDFDAWHAAVQRGTVRLRTVGRTAPRGRTRAAVVELLDAGMSQASIARQLGVSAPTVSFHARRLGIPARASAAQRYDWDEIRTFCRQHVKARLRLAGLKHECCEQCGLTDWRNRPLSLELHHVNGDGRDNRLENLMLLCPNCHSQTDTWGARNKGRRSADEESSGE